MRRSTAAMGPPASGCPPSAAASAAMAAPPACSSRSRRSGSRRRRAELRPRYVSRPPACAGPASGRRAGTRRQMATRCAKLLEDRHASKVGAPGFTAECLGSGRHPWHEGCCPVSKDTVLLKLGPACIPGGDAGPPAAAGPGLCAAAQGRRRRPAGQLRSQGGQQPGPGRGPCLADSVTSCFLLHRCAS